MKPWPNSTRFTTPERAQPLNLPGGSSPRTKASTPSERKTNETCRWLGGHPSSHQDQRYRYRPHTIRNGLKRPPSLRPYLDRTDTTHQHLTWIIITAGIANTRPFLASMSRCLGVHTYPSSGRGGINPPRPISATASLQPIHTQLLCSPKTTLQRTIILTQSTKLACVDALLSQRLTQSTGSALRKHLVA